MKRFNLVYITGFLVLIALLYINKNYSRHSASFYGFAENKETQINLDRAVEVSEVFVSPGQWVKKGTVLLKGTQSDIGQKINTLDLELGDLEVRRRGLSTEIRAQIAQLEARKLVRTSEINAQIATVEAKIRLNQSLAKGMKSVPVPLEEATAASETPESIQVTSLRNELKLEMESLDIQIEALNKGLQAQEQSLKLAMEKLEKEQLFFEEENHKFTIKAPSDGLVGSLQCKKGEFIPAFTTLITFYEQTPTLVKAYVHENDAHPCYTGEIP